MQNEFLKEEQLSSFESQDTTKPSLVKKGIKKIQNDLFKAKQFVCSHKKEIGFGVGLGIEVIGVLKSKQNSEQLNYSDDLQDNHYDIIQDQQSQNQLNNQKPTDEELLTRRDDEEYWIKSKDCYYKNGKPNRFYKLSWNYYDKDTKEWKSTEKDYGNNVDSAYEAFNDLKNKSYNAVNVKGWMKTQDTDWDVCWK